MDRHRPIINRLLPECKTGCLFVDRMVLWKFADVYVCHFYRILFISISVHCLGISEYIWMAKLEKKES